MLHPLQPLWILCLTFQKCHAGSNTHYTERAIIKFLTFSCLHDKGGMANPPIGPDNHSPVKSLQYTSSVFFLAELQVCLVNNFVFGVKPINHLPIHIGQRKVLVDLASATGEITSGYRKAECCWSNQTFSFHVVMVF